MSILLEIGLVAVLIIANGVFSMSETAVVSARRARLQQRAESGDAAASRALKLSEQPNVLLSTTQIGITLIGILSGAFGGARLSEPVADLLDGAPIIDRYAGTVAFILVVLAITYFSLVIGELVPKRIALNDPEGIASAIAGPMQRLSRAVGPIVHLLSVSTDALLRLLRVRQSNEPAVTEEEVSILLEQGALAGVFHPAERDMTERIFDLADDRVSALMTPRLEVTWIDVEASPDEIARIVITSPFSRFPVARESIDRTVGIVRAKEVLAEAATGGKAALPSELPKPLVVPESASALHVLERFRQAGDNMAIVIDEYGGTAGIITLQDILEAIVGDLSNDGEDADRGAIQRDDGSWLLDGKLPIDEVREILGLPALPGETEGIFETLAGFVISRFGHLPIAGEHTAWGGWVFEVVDMDGRRVDQILARPEEPTTPSD